VSQPESSSDAPRGVLVRRQKTTIYTVLLIITAAALVFGSLVLVLEIWQYGPPWSAPWKVPVNMR
jgi:hypothetical protein